MEKKLKSWQGWLLFGGSMVVVFVLGLCVSALMERRAEVASIFNNRKNVIKGIEARSFGGNHRFQIGSNIWGILYLKAIRYGEELTQAMEARCFVGEYVKSSQSFTWKDWFALIGLVVVILGQILLGG